MKFTRTHLDGVMLIEAEPIRDERGFFARTFCEDEFEGHGLQTRFVQQSISHSPKAYTLRGLHYQAEPHAEAKLVRCIRGAVFDVVVDLRPFSPTYREHLSVVLTAEALNAVYVPPGCAHGHLTTTDNTDLLYLISAFYHPPSARGVRWDDPTFGIRWPAEPRVISERDGAYPDFGEPQP